LATSFNQDINDWDTSSVTNMGSMFNGAVEFNGAILDWDTGEVTNMANMFKGATSFNGILDTWDVSNVTNMENMLDNSGMSALSYGSTLVGWSQLPNLPSNIVLGAVGLSIDCSHAPSVNAYTFLRANKSWDINDDSGHCF
ncbi:BspA family leucine-rich repeat surface protein, partial [Muricauda sp. SK9]